MPSKKHCPYLPEQLREVYQTKSSQQIADELTATGTPVHKTTVIRWLKDAGIDRKTFSPMTAGRLDSPFTPGRLRELYWKEGKSTIEIGSLASVIMNRSKPVFQATVTRWLTEAKVTLRTAAESQRVRARLHPEQFLTSIAAARSAQTPDSLRGYGKNGERLRKIQKKGSKLAAAKKKANRVWETRECQWPDCSKPITKPRSLFKNPPERTYCSKSHSNLYRRWLVEIGLASETKWAKRELLRVTRSCAQCGSSISRSPCRMKKERVFCNKSCSTTYQNSHREQQKGLKVTG